MSLAQRILSGDRLALARLVSHIENGDPRGEEALTELYPHTGQAHLVGVTGGTGTGKSTLVNQLARYLREHGIARGGNAATPVRVAVVAVDPSSPFSGGAILGDRIRMRDLAGDPDVFIRSMATRGAHGGLARRTRPVVQALDAAGYEVILIETVGAGQSEVEITRSAHTTLVVDAPGLGDEVQAIKAGILEIADVLVLNKADLPGADRAYATLRTALNLAPDRKREGGGDPEVWRVPLVKTVATEGEGVQELVGHLEQHMVYLEASGERALRDRERLRAQLTDLLRDELVEDFLSAQPEGVFESLVDRVVQRELSPREAVQGLVKPEVEH
ncbi:MAG: methylmalonyl Co-A mutase-associated GTPase MeaB [Anaerolineales bacterium]|nr:methylmalonyl Co-A mutase-associated GTPase MeaB [Anaerolineales bacterium]